MRDRGSAGHPAPSRAASAPAIGALLPGTLARLGLAEGIARWRAVVEWDAIVGEALACSTKARRIEGDTLVVETTDMFGMSHFKPGLLKLVRDHIGSELIRDIRLELKRN
ncbi:MAG: DUF721 domain-containing protein [Candidatus Eisenbacteria bacterium]